LPGPSNHVPFGPVAVIVMGVSGSGKSTLGVALAEALGCSFIEGDDYHSTEAIAKMQAGEPLGDGDRWPWLDRLGAAIGAAVTRDGMAVAACSALRRSYRERLIGAIVAPARFVLLDNPREELQRRLGNRPTHYMPPSLLDSQLATLERPGSDEQAITLDASAPVEVLCHDVLGWLQK
jgi:gluconokinase